MTRDFFEKNASTIHEKLTGMGAMLPAVWQTIQATLPQGYSIHVSETEGQYHPR
jgi:hypothetical protein